MKYLLVIPARGGSKGVPKKNIKPLDGVPLIAYTINEALSIFPAENICVSTDSEEIKNVVEGLGISVPFLRPKELATDQAGTYEVLLHAINFYEKKGNKPEVLILLQPTSPFRNKNHINSAIDIYEKNKNDIEMVVSVKETESNPYYVLFEEDQNGFLEKSKKGEFTRRQDCPKVYEINGAIYIINIEVLKSKNISQFTKIKKYIMDSKSSLDIDTPLDWKIAEYLINNFKNNEK